MTKPKPINDPHAGQYQVVVSFRIVPHPRVDAGDIRHAVYDVLKNDLASTEGIVSDLDVAVREIGAGGERSEDEGRWDRGRVLSAAEEFTDDPPNGLANLDDVQHVRATDDVQTRDRL